MAKLEDLIARDTRSNQPTAGVAGRLYFVEDEGDVLERDNGTTWENVVAPSSIDQSTCQGRLTLESGVPISTTNQDAKTTLYFTPFNGNNIALYDGATWQLLSFTEKSLSLSGYTADKNYDIWAYISSGDVALDSTVWTNDTTRATALAFQDGIYAKTGATTRRYLGTIRITATTGQCEDSLTKRFVYNYYNKVDRELLRVASSYNLNSGSWIAWNNNSTITIEFVNGVGFTIPITLHLFPISGGAYVELQSTVGSESIPVHTGAANASYTYSAHTFPITYSAGYIKRILCLKGSCNFYMVRASSILSI